MRVDPDGSGEIQGRVGIGRYKGGAYTYQWSGWGGYYGPDSRRGPLVTLGWNTPTDGRQATYYSQPPNIEMKICIRSDGRDDKSYENDCPGSGWGVMEATCKVNDYK